MPVTPPRPVRHGETSIGTQRAWRLPSGAVLCADDQTFNDTRHGHMIALNLYFPARVTEEQELAAAATLLSADAQHTSNFPGVNNDVSTVPNGS
jgi:hypothetical protein